MLNKVMNYLESFPHSNFKMMCAVESVISNLTPAKGVERRRKIRSAMEKCNLLLSV
jgi:hypothetical protein